MINKNTIEILQSDLKTRYSIFLELETDNNKINQVKYGNQLNFHINQILQNHIQVYGQHNVADIMRKRYPLTQYWEELEQREKIINHTIITKLNEGKEEIKGR